MRKDPKPEDIALGNRIKWVRENVAKVKPGAFALPIGVTRQAVVNWERGHGADRKKLEKLAVHYGIDFDWLATNRGDPMPGKSAHKAAPPVEQTPAKPRSPSAVTARLGELFAAILKADEDIQIEAIKVLERVAPADRQRSRLIKTKAQS